MIEYWHWNTLRYGAETYWGGVLPHSDRPGRTYRELAALGAEIEAAGGLVAGVAPEADVTMLQSLPSKWLMQEHPPLATRTWEPDPDSYHGLFDPFYRGAFDAGCQVRVMHVDQLITKHGDGARPDLSEAVLRHPLLVVPGLYVADDDTLQWLAEYAAAGGHLVIGPRTAYGDEEARARAQVVPAHLASAAGTWYDEFSNLADAIPVTSSDASFPVPESASGTRWVDALTLDGADALATYEHPHFGRWPAITTRAHGSGRVTMVGTVPNPDLARALFAYLIPQPLSGWGALPSGVTVSTAMTAGGQRLHVVHNWSWITTTVTAPVDLTGVPSGSISHAGNRLELGSWDVRIFVAD